LWRQVKQLSVGDYNLKINNNDSLLNIGFETIFEWDFGGISAEKVKNGYCVIIRELKFFNDKYHKIYFKTRDDANEYVRGIVTIRKGSVRSLEVPDGFISKKELKEQKNKTNF